jgi:hypothetical protein
MAVAFVGFLMTSCVGDPISSNPDIAKLSDKSKKAIDESSKNMCECLKIHKEDLKSLTELINDFKPKIAKAEESKEVALEIIQDLGPKMSMRELGGCMESKRSKIEDEDRESIDKDIDKIVGEKPDRRIREMKIMDIYLSYFGKNCPSEAKLFSQIIEFAKKMDKLSER